MSDFSQIEDNGDVLSPLCDQGNKESKSAGFFSKGNFVVSRRLKMDRLPLTFVVGDDHDLEPKFFCSKKLRPSKYFFESRCNGDLNTSSYRKQ